LAAEGKVITLHHEYLAFEFRAMGVVMDDLEQPLSRHVTRVRLAGEDKYHRTLGVVYQPRQSLGIREQQCGALVGGKAARETDGQYILLRRGQVPCHALDLRGAGAVAPEL